MLDTVFGVFDRNLDIMGSVVNKVLDVFEESEEKKALLLEAWNGMKVEVDITTFMLKGCGSLTIIQRNGINRFPSLQ